MEQLLKILEDIRPDLDFSQEDKLVDAGILDSFDIITIVGELNDSFGIGINVNDIVPENLNSAENMWQLICRLKQ